MEPIMLQVLPKPLERSTPVLETSDIDSMLLWQAPIGFIGIKTAYDALEKVYIEPVNVAQSHDTPQNDVEALTLGALQAYFKGDFNRYQVLLSQIPTRPVGTSFQKQVWQALSTIPLGETRSYKWLAQAIDNPNAIRAVGQANRRNPLPILVPCHRVVNQNGDLGGYMGKNNPYDNALTIKQTLLNLEAGKDF